MGKCVGVFGASGFVGTSILQYLRSFNAEARAFSRNKRIPNHLKPLFVMKGFSWNQFDEPNLKDLDSAVISIGSAPIPTFNQADFDRKVFENGGLVAKLIDSAEAAGVKNIVLISATMPNLTPTAYKTGKLLARQRLEDFTKKDGCVGSIIAPNVIYGTRSQMSTKPSMPSIISPVLQGTSLALSGLKKTGITNLAENAFPSVFKNLLDPFVTVSEVGYLAAKCATDNMAAQSAAASYCEYGPKEIKKIYRS